MTIVYDGDGNRVSDAVGGITTSYLVHTENPTVRVAHPFWSLFLRALFPRVPHLSNAALC